MARQLNDGRFLQSAEKAAASGERISLTQYEPKGWTPTGKPVTPVCWSENCITLLPGEQASPTATLPAEGLHVGDLAIGLDGWNLRR